MSNDKQFTIEDMRKLWEYVEQRGMNFMDDTLPQLGTFEEYIKSLNK